MSLPLITHPDYSYALAQNHRFPMEKFRLLNACLIEMGIATSQNTFRPGKAKAQLLEMAHCPQYLSRFINNGQSKAELRRMGLPWSEQLLRRTILSPSGTLLSAQLALQKGIACHLAGGTHHAHFDFASGFCILNDLAITAKSLLASGLVNSVLIFDVDVHQGDGTARILADVPQAFTCSVHCEKNFPARKAQSDLDVNVPKGASDDQYMALMAEGFENAVALSKPDIVLYDAGVDVYEQDPLGLINVSLKGIRARDRYVLTRCAESSIPVATVIGGGYDKDQKALAQRHAIAVEEAATLYKAHF